MKTIAPRKYAVTAEDFPITIEITAVDLLDNLAVVGSVRDISGGMLVSKRTPVVSAPSALVKRYVIDLPADIPSDITHHVDCWFPAIAPGTARYTVSLVAATGAVASATLRVPTINPNFANFSFSF